MLGIFWLNWVSQWHREQTKRHWAYRKPGFNATWEAEHIEEVPFAQILRGRWHSTDWKGRVSSEQGTLCEDVLVWTSDFMCHVEGDYTTNPRSYCVAKWHTAWSRDISTHSCPRALSSGDQGQDTHSGFGGEHPSLLSHTVCARRKQARNEGVYGRGLHSSSWTWPATPEASDGKFYFGWVSWHKLILALGRWKKIYEFEACFSHRGRSCLKKKKKGKERIGRKEERRRKLWFEPGLT